MRTPPAPGQVDAWLDGDDVARRQRVGRGLREPGILVDLETDRVAEAVHHLVPLLA